MTAEASFKLQGQDLNLDVSNYSYDSCSYILT